MIFILITSAVAAAIMTPVFFHQLISGVPGVRKFALSAGLASLAIAMMATPGIAPALVYNVASGSIMIAACLLLLSAFHEFFARPPLPLAIGAPIVGAVVVLLAVFTYLYDSQVGRTTVGAGAAAVILGVIAWNIARSRSSADVPDAYIRFAFWACAWVSFFNVVRMVVVATGIDMSDHFIEPTSVNLALSSIRILSLPLVYLAAVLLVQGRIISSLQRALTYDDLTGVLSRRSFLQACEGRSPASTGGEAGFSLLFLDLDHFKRLNDRYGHALGNKALGHFAATISRAVPPEARIGRLGGEEFAVWLPSVDAEGGIAVAEAIIAAVRAHPLMEGATLIPMTVSVGIAVAEPGESLDQVMNRADFGLYHAKADGRDRYHLACRQVTHPGHEALAAGRPDDAPLPPAAAPMAAPGIVPDDGLPLPARRRSVRAES